MGFWDAFALSAPPDKSDEEAAKYIARQVVARGMAAPAIFFLESMKPFTFLANQAAIGFEPLAASFMDRSKYDKLPKFLEKRENIERVIQYIEEYSNQKPEPKEGKS